MKDFSGMYAALLTAFDKDGNINYEATGMLAERNIEKGLTGMYVAGSSGEAMLMSEEERISLLEYVARIAGGKVTLIAHVGSSSTDSAVRMAKKAADLGYDAVSAVAPYYYSFSGEAIRGYYTDIMNATSLPMLIYNFPASGGFDGMLSLVSEMIDDPRLMGVKHTSVNLFELERFKHLKRPLTVFNGFDEMLIGGLSMGADGGIGSTYNFMQDEILAVYRAFKEGDLKKAMEAQTKVNRIIEAMLPYGVFAMEKAILTEMGVPMGGCRKPFLPLSPEGRACAARIAEELISLPKKM